MRKILIIMFGLQLVWVGWLTAGLVLLNNGDKSWIAQESIYDFANYLNLSTACFYLILFRMNQVIEYQQASDKDP